MSDHFKEVEPAVRKAYLTLRKAVLQIGRVTVYAQKTRIVFQARARFAGVSPRKHWLDGTLWLKRRADHPRFRRVDVLAGRDYVHHFRVMHPHEIDDSFMNLLREAYEVGSQSML